MAMPAHESVTTIRELLALPGDGLRHELLAGAHVVTPAPSPRHERAVWALARAIAPAIDTRNDLELFPLAADLQLGAATLVQPDLSVVQSDPADRFQDWGEAPTPLLVVEVLSPATAARDRGVKRRLYLEAGVEEYWIVDLDARVVERWRQGDARPEIVDGVLEWSLSVGVSGRIDVAGLLET